MGVFHAHSLAQTSFKRSNLNTINVWDLEDPDFTELFRQYLLFI
jgi:hypothetical protein